MPSSEGKTRPGGAVTARVRPASTLRARKDALANLISLPTVRVWMLVEVEGRSVRATVRAGAQDVLGDVQVSVPSKLQDALVDLMDEATPAATLALKHGIAETLTASEPD